MSSAFVRLQELRRLDSKQIFNTPEPVTSGLKRLLKYDPELQGLHGLTPSQAEDYRQHWRTLLHRTVQMTPSNMLDAYHLLKSLNAQKILALHLSTLFKTCFLMLCLYAVIHLSNYRIDTTLLPFALPLALTLYHLTWTGETGNYQEAARKLKVSFTYFGLNWKN